MKYAFLFILLVCLSFGTACTAERDYTTEAAREPEFSDRDQAAKRQPKVDMPKSEREIDRKDYTPEMARTERDRAKLQKETLGDSIDDAWIHAKITTKLIGDPDTPGRKINIDVNNNVVTLRGMVDTAEAKTEAEKIAMQTDGVKRVINQLKVGTK